MSLTGKEDREDLVRWQLRDSGQIDRFPILEFLEGLPELYPTRLAVGMVC